MVVDIVRCTMTNLIIAMEGKFIVIVMIITCTLPMLLGVIPGLGKCLHHGVKIAGVKLYSGHVLKLLGVIPIMLTCRARSCQATKVTHTTLMKRMPPTSQRRKKKQRSVVAQVWSAVSDWCSLIACLVSVAPSIAV